MATAVHTTCPECGYQIRLDYAVTTSELDNGDVLHEINQTVLLLHTCLRDES